MNSWKSLAILASGALANQGCSIDQSVLEPRPFHKGWTFHGCDSQTDENSVVPSGTTCKKVWCNQFKFSIAYNVECKDGAWSELPTCFKGCAAPTSKAGYQFVGCRKNMGNGTTKHKGWYEDNDGTVFYPPQQRCRKVQCPSAKKEFTKTLSKEDKQSLYEVNQDKASRFECNCNVEGECFWIHFNDETYGADINDDLGIELSCASWSEWSSEGQSCTRKKRAEVRECKQPNGDDGTPGVDCKGEGTRTKPCGRRLN
jgi:hypothetical protein